MVVLVTCKNEKKYCSKMKAPVLSQHFSHHQSMGFFPDAQGQLHMQSLVPSCRISKPIQDFITALVTCKNKDDLIKNEGARVVKTLFIDFSDSQGQITL